MDPSNRPNSISTLLAILVLVLPALAVAQEEIEAPGAYQREAPALEPSFEVGPDALEAQAEEIEETGRAAGLSPATARQVEEIVVRARKREELLEDTPVSVTALSATTPERRRGDQYRRDPEPGAESDRAARTQRAARHLHRPRGVELPLRLLRPGSRRLRRRGPFSPATTARCWTSSTSSRSRCCAVPRGRCSARTRWGERSTSPPSPRRKSSRARSRCAPGATTPSTAG